MRRSVALAALLCLGAAAAHAATWTVDTLNDDSTTLALTARSNCAAGNSGTCALRDAILAAIADNSGDTVDFSVTGTITLTNTLPTISSSLTITGPGANQLALSGNGAHQVFLIQGAANTTTVSISGLTIADGNSVGSGGISFAAGTLTVTDCTFTGNRSSGSGNNLGGALGVGEGNLVVTGSTFINNSAGFEGGAIYAGSSTTITNSTFTGNSSQHGGAIYLYGTSALTVTNSTFSGNSASEGGAISAATTLTANNNIFSGNSSTGGGAAIYNNGGTVTASNNVYYNNLTGGSEDDCIGCTTGAPGSDGNTDATANPLLPLANYGGPAETMLPAPSNSTFTNPAICGGSDSLAAAAGLTGANALDQRGFPLVSSCVDAGADQSNYIQVESSGDSGGGSSDCPGASCTLRDAIALANGNSPSGYGDIDFAPGVTTINLTPANGDLTLSGSGGINIAGSGFGKVTVNGNGSSSNELNVFHVSIGDTATLYGLTVTGGYAGPSALSGGSGGGIAVALNASLAVLDSVVSGNTAKGSGGGIYNPAAGTLTVEDSSISGNAAQLGAGIYNGGTMTLTDSTVSGNSINGASGKGAGVLNEGTLTIAESTISDNSIPSTFIAGFAAGLFSNGTLSVTDSTIANNSNLASTAADNEDGGLYISGGTATLTNTIVAGNTAANDANIGNYGTLNDTSGDVIGGGTNSTTSLLNGTGAGITLSPLQLNGIGATLQTMIPLPGSAAICAGLASNIFSGTTTDERGYPVENTTYTGYSASAPCVDAGAVQTHYTSAAFVQQPSSTADNVAISPAPTVGVYETDTLLSAPNNTDAVGGVPLTLTASGGTYAGSALQATGSSASPFLASFSNLSSSSAASDIQLTLPDITVVGSDTLGSEDSDSYNVYGAATHLAVSAPPTAVVGMSFFVTITAEDAKGSTVINFPPTDFVQPSSTDPMAAFAAVNLPGGTATIAPTLKTAGTQTITATDITPGSSYEGLAGTSGTIEVSPPPAPATLIASAGASQQTYVNLAFPTALQATVEDAHGNPVIGATVDFAAPGSGASATLSAGSCVTAGNGSCSVTATANATAGSYNVTAAVSGYSSLTASFTLTNNPPPNLVVTTIADDPNPTTSAGTATNCTVQTSTTVGTDASCSLRDALAEAASLGTANIYFSYAVFGTPQTMTVQGNFAGTILPLNIPQYTTIHGPTSGSGLTLTNLLTVYPEGMEGGAFQVNSGVEGAAIANLTITGGNDTNAGAITNDGTLTLTDCTISNNYGGTAVADDGTLTVIGCTFSGNQNVNDDGGAIQDNGTATVIDSTFYYNSAYTGGGAIGAMSGKAVALTVINSTFVGNYVANDTTSGSTGYGLGPDINFANSAFIPTLLNDIFQLYSVYPGATDQDYTYGNVEYKASIERLAPLGNYGGPTQTMPPLPGSVGICLGKQAFFPAGVTTDQRGQPLTGYCPAGYMDAGAVQTDYALSFTRQPTSVITATTMSPAPAATLTESGLPFTGGGVTIPLTLSGNGTLSGGSAVTSNGVATYSGLSVSAAGTGDTLTASLNLTYFPNKPVNPEPVLTATSSPFNVNATLLVVSAPGAVVAGVPFSVTVTAEGAGSGTDNDTVKLIITGTSTSVGTVTLSGGTGSAMVALSAAGTVTLTGTDTSSSFITGTSGSIAVNTVAPAALAASGGTPQSAYVRTAFATPLQATLTSNGNTPLAGVTINFAAPSSGASASLSAPSCVTGTNGTCSITATANSTVGSYDVTASVNGYSSLTVSFVLTNTPPPNLVVTTTQDFATGKPSNCSVQSSTTTGTDASCSLRDALAEAEILGAANVYFDNARIAGTTITLTGGTLNIPSNTAIQGPASMVIVNGGGKSTVFNVAGGVTRASISNLMITGGYSATGNTYEVSGFGGGISNAGTLTVTGIIVSINTSQWGAGISNTGTLIVQHSLITRNYANIDGNDGGGGGGIASSGTLTVEESTIYGNTAFGGGGIYVQNGGESTIQGSTIIDNIALAGSAVPSPPVGGGIYVASGTLTLNNSIVAGNSLGSGGGSNADISGNFAGAGNLASNNSASSSTINPELSGLGNYGGTTQTLIPLPGSPAICAGLASDVPSGTTTDQRGVAFNAGGYCPSGSVDAGAVQTDYALNFTQQPVSVAPGATMSPAPTVTLTENGLPFGGESVPIPLTLRGNGTLSGGSASTASGVATYSSLSVSAVGTGDTLTASLNVFSSTNITGTSNGFNVYGAATHLVVSAPATAVVGTPFPVTITAEDANGSTVINFPPTDFVQPSSTDPMAAFAAVNLPGGTATIVPTLETAGTQTISATDLTTGSSYQGLTGTSGTIMVTLGTPAKLIASAGASQQSFVNLVFPTALQATVEDARGNPVTEAVVNFTETMAGAYATLSSPSCTTGANGSCSITATANGTTGSYNVTAAVSGYPALGSVSFALTNQLPTFVVNTTSDDATGTASNCTSSPEGTCTLRDALAAASNVGEGYIINFDPTVFAASNSAAQNTITLTGQLNITSNTSIIGPAAGVTVSGGGSTSNFPVFVITQEVTNAEISGLTITNGNATGGAGGILNLGTLVIANSTISGNTATGASQGGGIWNFVGATLTISNSTISGNRAGAGGGIVNQGTLTISNSTISGNTDGGTAGGIYIVNDAVTVVNSIIAGNTPSDCAGSCPANGSNGNVIGGTPNLATLGNFGGPTQTMLPEPGSPAICAGSASAAASAGIARDQRGVVLNLTSSNAGAYSGAGGYCPAGSIDAGAVQTDYSLGFAQQPPATVALGASMSPSPAVQLDESGKPIALSGASISVAAEAGTLSGTTTETTGSTGLATFSGLSIATAESGDTLTASLALNPAITPNGPAISAISSAFQAGQATPTLSFTLSPNAQTYGAAIGSLNATANYNGSSVAGTFTYTTRVNGGTETLTDVTVLPVGSYTVTAMFTPSDTTNYTTASQTASYTVTPAALTVTAGNTNTTYGTAPTVSASYSGFVAGNTPASLSTAATCTSTVTAATPVGTYTGANTCAGAVDPNYVISYVAGTATVTQKKAQSISFTQPASPVVYGVAPIALSATANSGLAVTFSVVSGPGTISGSTLRVTGAGSIVVAANQAGDTTYAAATQVTRTIAVNPAALTITAGNGTFVYGGTVPAITPGYSGFVGSDSSSSLTAQPSCSTTATSTSPVSSYPSRCSGAVDANYTIGYVAGSVRVTPAALTVTASNTNTTSGSAPTVSASYSGFVAGNTPASLSTAATCTSTVTAATPVGTYTGANTCAGAVDPNYVISYVAGTATVTQKKAQSISFTQPASPVVYGVAPIALSATANSGLAVTFSVVSGPGTISGSTLRVTGAGSIVVAANQAGDTTYAAATQVTRTIAVNPAALTITAGNGTFVYGGTVPAITPGYSGFVGSDSSSSLTAQPSCSTTATSRSTVGSYPSSCTGAAAANYTISYTAGSVTVDAAPLTVVVNSATKVYDTANPAFTGTVSGLVGSDTATSVGLAYTTTATTSSSVGAYPITASITSANYTLSVTAGTLTVSQLALTVSAANATRIYGTANPVFTGSVSGAVNGDSFTESFATAATPSSNAGSYAIVPSVAGADLSDYALTTENGTLTVTQAASATALTLSSTSIDPGQSLVLTATVTDASPNSTGTPAGTVNFYDGTTLLDTATLSGGVASYATTALSAGSSNNITAVYSGDENFTGSSTSSATDVSVAQLNFTMTLNGPGNATVGPGGTLVYTIKVNPDYGSYAGPVSFAVSGLPTGATATFSPASVPANGGPQNVTVTITFPATTAANHPSSIGQRLSPVALAFLLLPFAGGLRRQGRRLRRLSCLLLLALAGAAATTVLTGCGSVGGYFAQPQQSYDVTITATAGNLTQSATFTVHVE